MRGETTTTRRIAYRRVGWLRSPAEGATLQRCVEAVCENRPRALDRLIDRGESGSVFMNNWDVLPSSSAIRGVCGELIAYTQGRPAEIAHTRLLQNATIDIEAIQPAEGQDFVEGRAFFVITGDHAAVSTSGSMRERSVVFYLQGIIKSEFNQSCEFQLGSVMRREVMSDIAQFGVKSIELDAQVFSETVNLMNESAVQGFASTVFGFLRNQFAGSLSEDEIRVLSDLQMEVKLELKGHHWRIGQAPLGSFAQRIADEAEADYIITLGNGWEIRPNEIRYTKDVRVPLANRRVDHVRLWEKMNDYLVELSESRVMDV
jgi:hypothetical protein